MSLWWSRVWNRSKVLGTDGMKLLLLVAKNPTQRVRDTVVNAARTPKGANAAAIQLLHLEQEVNLMRYHGLQWYWDQRARHMILPSSNASTSSSWFSTTSGQPHNQTGRSGTVSATTSEKQDTPPERQKQRARVAFMITSSQRVELRERLGFEESSIRKLTPKAAAFLLEQSICIADIASPQDSSSLGWTAGMDAETVQTIRKAVGGTTRAQEPQHHRSKKETVLENVSLSAPAVQEKSTQLLSAKSSSEADSGFNDKHGTALSETSLVDGAVSSSLLDSMPQPEHAPKRAWFQVTEAKLDGDKATTVVGLYTDEKEAQICLDTKRQLASKHGKRATFQVEKVER